MPVISFQTIGQRLDVDAIHQFLTQCRWAAGISRAVVARSVANSLCLGVYGPNGEQVGLVRVVTDYATFAYVCDVYVLAEHRGQGLAQAAMKAYATHPQLQHLRREHLVTPDMQALYRKFGFAPVAQPGWHMEKRNSSTFQS
jgi:GNAT superfamily N-acetyltransferase